MDEDPPVCPGCGAVAELHGPNEMVDEEHWETAHRIDCSWMADPDSPRYDE